MAKAVSNDVLDAALDKIATSTSLVLCSAEPANQAGIAAVTLGTYTIDGSDFTKADGDVSGRKTTVGSQTGNNASATGDGTHVALSDGTTLLYVTTCPTKGVTSGEPFDVSSWKVEIADPT
jgi:hypothetical protein